jgi:glutamine cyclotransferase
MARNAKRKAEHGRRSAGSKRIAASAAVIAIILSVVVFLFARREVPRGEVSAPASNNAQGAADSSLARKAAYEVVASYPHDPQAYTQGLLWHDGGFFESTGLYEHSTLRRVEFPSGKVLKSISLAPNLFGEGLALAEGQLIQLTWKAGRAFLYDPLSFQLVREFTYDTEGWGLTYDGKNLIMSDGSSTLYYLDPGTFRRVKTLGVTLNGSPLQNLNELEFINDEIWSNVWLTDVIVRIDPATGRVTSYLDMKGLLPPDQRRESDDVLNGIAYDAAGKRIFVGGKRWPLLFQIKLK